MRRILIADDHAVVRHGYKQFLAAEGEPTEIGEASAYLELVSKLGEHSWDLLILDTHLPGFDGIAQLGELVTNYPPMRVLVISALPERLYARSALRAGAHGFLSKQSSEKEMLKAVRIVLAGSHYVSAELAQIMVEDIELDSSKPLHALLSSRELQVFRKIASGWGVTQIARDLTLSVKTVSTYRTRILEKMRFTSNAEITAYAIRHDVRTETEA